MEEYDKIKLHILLKLIRKRMWQHKHTSIHNLPKGMPDYLRDNKLIKVARKYGIFTKMPK